MFLMVLVQVVGFVVVMHHFCGGGVDDFDGGEDRHVGRGGGDVDEMVMGCSMGAVVVGSVSYVLVRVRG